MEADSNTSYYIKDIEELIADEQYAKLTILINRQIKKFFFKGVKPDAGDILNTVVMKILTGKRKWDKEKEPDLKNYVLMVAFSEIRHYIGCKANKNLSIDAKAEEFDDEETRRDENCIYIKDNSDFLNDLYAKELNEKCIEALKDDEDALLVYYERIEGKSNRSITKSLGVDIQFVENAMKRIKRKFRQLLCQ